MAECPNGHEAAEGQHFCGRCGAPVRGESGPTTVEPPQAHAHDEGGLRRCPNGHEVEHEDIECEICGYSLGQPATQPPAAPATGSPSATDEPDNTIRFPEGATSPAESTNGDRSATGSTGVTPPAVRVGRGRVQAAQEWMGESHHAHWLVTGATVLALLLVLGIVKLTESRVEARGDPDFVQRATRSCNQVLDGVHDRFVATLPDASSYGRPFDLDEFDADSARRDREYDDAVGTIDSGLSHLSDLNPPRELDDTYDDFLDTLSDVADDSETQEAFGFDTLQVPITGQVADMDAIDAAANNQQADSERLDDLAQELGLGCSTD